MAELDYMPCLKPDIKKLSILKGVLMDKRGDAVEL